MHTLSPLIRATAALAGAVTFGGLIDRHLPTEPSSAHAHDHLLAQVQQLREEENFYPREPTQLASSGASPRPCASGPVVAASDAREPKLAKPTRD